MARARTRMRVLGTPLFSPFAVKSEDFRRTRRSWLFSPRGEVRATGFALLLGPPVEPWQVTPRQVATTTGTHSRHSRRLGSPPNRARGRMSAASRDVPSLPWLEVLGHLRMRLAPPTPWSIVAGGSPRREGRQAVYQCHEVDARARGYRASSPNRPSLPARTLRDVSQYGVSGPRLGRPIRPLDDFLSKHFPLRRSRPARRSRYFGPALEQSDAPHRRPDSHSLNAFSRREQISTCTGEGRNPDYSSLAPPKKLIGAKVCPRTTKKI